MSATMGSIDLKTFKDLRDDVTQYFWFESNSSSAWGSGAHVTLYPESQFTNSTSPNYMKGQNIIMNIDGFSIRNGGLPMMVLDNDSLDFNAIDTIAGTYVNVATFGMNESRIGRDDDVHIEIDEDSFVMKDNLGNEFAHIGSPSGSQVTDTFVYNGIDNYFMLTFAPIDEPVVLLNGNGLISGTDYTISNRNLHVTTSLQSGDVIEATYTSLSQKKYYIFGTSVGNSGMYSFSEGNMVSASGAYGAHAEGNHTIASGAYGAHAEGDYTEAIGDFSHAQNIHTIAKYNAQTVIGAYNDNDSLSLFEIGNGTSDNNRSNAFTVDWYGNVNCVGNVKCAGYITASNHTNPIGWYDAHSNTSSISSGTSYQSISSSEISLPAGRYMLFGSARFSGASSGYRGITIFEGSSSLGRASASQPAIPSSSWTTAMNCSCFVAVSSTTSYKLGVYQNSGSSLSTAWDFYAVAIR